MSTVVIELQQPISWKQQIENYVNQLSNTIPLFFQKQAVGLKRKLDQVIAFMQFQAKVQNNAGEKADAEKTNAEDANAKAARILHDYGNGILRMAYSYLQNMDDAEEILQETLIQFLTKAPKFENAEHEKAWLLHVAANLSKNRIKYNQIRKTDELDETLIAEEKEDLAFVWEAVKSLPEKYREVIHLHYHEGYQTAQIAQILNRRESTIRSDLRRGREKLRTILKEAYDFE